MRAAVAVLCQILVLAASVAAQKPDEAALRQKVQAEPRNGEHYYALAKFLEGEAKLTEAEKVLVAARDAIPNDLNTYTMLAGFYSRMGEFDKAMAALQQMVARDPADAESHYIVAVYYWDKAYKDPLLTPAEKHALAAKGLDAANLALKYRPEYPDAMVYKGLLLRVQALVEPDAAVQQRLLAEANALSARAKTMMDRAKASPPAAAEPPPIRLPPEDQDYGVDVAFVTVRSAALRKTPDMQGAVVRTMPGGAALVMVTRNASNGWYNVVDADTSDEGWIRADQVTLRLTKQPKASPFEATKGAAEAQPTVVVTNDADLEITLTFGEVKHHIAPKGTLNLTVAPGTHKYIASAPGVLPYVGTDTLEAGFKYSWKFYIQKKAP